MNFPDSLLNACFVSSRYTGMAPFIDSYLPRQIFSTFTAQLALSLLYRLLRPTRYVQLPSHQGPLRRAFLHLAEASPREPGLPLPLIMAEHDR